MVLVIAAIVAAVLVVGIAVYELVCWLVDQSARDRFDSMSPEEQRKYQEDMHKAQAYHNS